MAESKEAKIVLERTYNVPLRKEWLNAPKWKRTKKAVIALRQFLQRHMKSENIKIGVNANELLWKHGIKNPPHHIKLNVTKDSEGNVFAELEGVKVEAPKEEKKAKKEEKKAEPKPAEKKEAPKVEKKAEAPKAEKKEQEKIAEIAEQIMKKGTARKN